MFARALIVLLLTLNLGVAVWWIARPAVVSPPPPLPPAGVQPLRLLGEASPAPVSAAPARGGALRCVTLGPFPGEAEAVSSRAALLGWGAASVSLRAPAEAARGWNVSMPPVADPATAQAMAARIRAAGFEDLLVMPTGDGGHGVALGRYGSEASARQRVAALRAAGFEAQSSPIIDPTTTRWLDVAVPGERDVLEAPRVAEARSSQAIDCGTIIDGPPDAPR